jgi:hypothetical protein
VAEGLEPGPKDGQLDRVGLGQAAGRQGRRGSSSATGDALALLIGRFKNWVSNFMLG